MWSFENRVISINKWTKSFVFEAFRIVDHVEHVSGRSDRFWAFKDRLQVKILIQTGRSDDPERGYAMERIVENFNVHISLNCHKNFRQ